MISFPLNFLSFTWLLFGLVLTVYFVPRARKRQNLPPGPARLPLLGNAHQLPTKTPWAVFSEWSKTYGDLIHIDLFGQPIIVINSLKIASDLMDKRSLIYSDRPNVPLAKMTSLGDTLVFEPCNDNWRKQRKAIAQDLATAGVSQFYAIQEREWRLQVKSILRKPETIFSDIKWRAGVIAIRVFYGYLVRDKDDPMLSFPLQSIAEFSRLTTPGASLTLMFLPRWTPGVTFLKDAANFERLHTTAASRPYEWSRENVKTGNALMPNICCNVWEKGKEDLGDDEHYQIYNALASALGGALDSNASVAATFYMNMILHPDVQRKGQAEIDAVVGSDRLPKISDMPNLPYVRAILTESLRFMPPIPMSIPHALKEDDTYEGYFLPKGAWIMPNIWHMLRDPELYPDPMTFNPDRYNGDDEAMERTRSPVFGFGRRVCPGQLFGESSIFALLATTLATCDILPGLDENGKEVFPSGAYYSGTISFPEPFKIRMKSRSAAAEALLAEVHDTIE